MSPIQTANLRNKKKKQQQNRNTNKNKKNKNARSKSRSLSPVSRSRSRSPAAKTRKNKKTSKKQKSNRVVGYEDNEGNVGTTGKKQKKQKKNKRQQRSANTESATHNSNEDIVLYNSSSVADKEVFTSGDKVMVSVNFKNSQNKSAAEIAATTKASCTIDIMSSPYQVIEPSPEPIVDVYSEEESEMAPTMTEVLLEKKSNNNDLQIRGDLTKTIENDNTRINTMIIEEADNNVERIERIETHKGPQTPPNIHESVELAKGPQTPDDPFSDPLDSYDPCSPTASPELAMDDGDNLLNSSSSSSPSHHREDLLKTAANTVPFLVEDLAQRLENNDKNVSSTTNNDINANNFDNEIVDMDMDSPFSPTFGECSDLFEPPSLFTPTKKGRKANGNVSSSTKMHSKPGKKGRKVGDTANNNKHVKMKVVDDKLKIIDDVPTSAVEMAVKEKFLKKVQRQERIVEEIKTVLKPHYNRKRINKDDYKEILRKCVPKVCHSKKGDINPTKIQKLVKGYVRKYHHSRKRTNMN